MHMALRCDFPHRPAFDPFIRLVLNQFVRAVNSSQNINMLNAKKTKRNIAASSIQHRLSLLKGSVHVVERFALPAESDH